MCGRAVHESGACIARQRVCWGGGGGLWRGGGQQPNNTLSLTDARRKHPQLLKRIKFHISETRYLLRGGSDTTGCGTSPERACATLHYLLEQYSPLQHPLVANNDSTNADSVENSTVTEEVAEMDMHIIIDRDVTIEPQSMVGHCFATVFL